MKKYIILHGHFYQPPREDPWTGLIEHQASAHPFANWNKRITAECYAACGASRILDDKGRIRSIANNYRTLSWNFGPTLLSWLEHEAPNVYDRIIDADRESRKRLGHGNAVAQGFNHTILPLDSPEDARTQIRWGLADFRRRFGRDAEGMWLPECGVNETVLDILIDEGLQYVILSPWQAQAHTDKTGRWIELGDRPAPSDRPFRLQRPQGEIAAFFYDGELASGISFGHLLRSREGFEKAIRNALRHAEQPLVTIATDGEIYGHHEPYGDMCLAALTDHLSEDSDLVFTNYAAYLSQNPPKQEARLKPGDLHQGTSWSCAHGVSRWKEDCGCSTGSEESWNQSWRAPLRKAFDGLAERSRPIWAETIKGLTGRDAREVLDSYGNVLSGEATPERFASGVLKESGDSAQRVRLLEILEGVKYLQFMYTSCGWFFAELSGLEPVQNIRYAYRAAELLDPDETLGLRQHLADLLRHAHSNIRSKGTGSDILKRDAIPAYPPEIRAAAEFFWRHLYNLPGVGDDASGDYRMTDLTQRTTDAQGGRLVLEGEIAFLRHSTGRAKRYMYRAEIDTSLFSPRVLIEAAGEQATVPISAIPTSLRYEIRQTLLKRSEKKLKKFIGGQASSRLRDLMIVNELNLPLGASGWQSLELSLHYGPILTIERLRKLPPAKWPESLAALDEILGQCALHNADTGFADLESLAGKLVSEIAESLQGHFEEEVLEQLVDFLNVLYRYGLRPLKPYAQNTVYALLESRYSAEEDNSGNTCEELSDMDLVKLAHLMNINPERFNQGTTMC